MGLWLVGCQGLIDNIDRDLRFAIETEGKARLQDVENYSDVKAQIVERLADLRDNPIRDEPPLIYHLDVGAMYPNIILTNRCAGGFDQEGWVRVQPWLKAICVGQAPAVLDCGQGRVRRL
jgi:hypothetical protein